MNLTIADFMILLVDFMILLEALWQPFSDFVKTDFIDDFYCKLVQAGPMLSCTAATLNSGYIAFDRMRYF